MLSANDNKPQQLDLAAQEPDTIIITTPIAKWKPGTKKATNWVGYIGKIK